jgi:hypothetical protein
MAELPPPPEPRPALAERTVTRIASEREPGDPPDQEGRTVRSSLRRKQDQYNGDVGNGTDGHGQGEWQNFAYDVAHVSLLIAHAYRHSTPAGFRSPSMAARLVPERISSRPERSSPFKTPAVNAVWLPPPWHAIATRLLSLVTSTGSSSYRGSSSSSCDRCGPAAEGWSAALSSAPASTMEAERLR